MKTEEIEEVTKCLFFCCFFVKEGNLTALLFFAKQEGACFSGETVY